MLHCSTIKCRLSSRACSIMDEDNSKQTLPTTSSAALLALADRVLDNSTDELGGLCARRYSGGRSTARLTRRRAVYRRGEGLSALRTITGNGVITTAESDCCRCADRRRTNQIVTPRIAYAYNFSEERRWAIVSATRGFKSGGWNARGTAASQLSSRSDLRPCGRTRRVWSADYLDNKLRRQRNACSTPILRICRRRQRRPSGAVPDDQCRRS